MDAGKLICSLLGAPWEDLVSGVWPFQKHEGKGCPVFTAAPPLGQTLVGKTP